MEVKPNDCFTLMKRTAYMLFLLASAAGCSDDPSDATLPGEPSVGASPWYAAFSEEGGTASAAVASNRARWNAECDAEWLTAEPADGCVALTASPNGEVGSRSAYVYLSAGEEGEIPARDSVYVFQSGRTTLDLSAEGTANCYIAPTGTDCSFDASVKGNGGSDGASGYAAACGLSVEGAAWADLLWEAAFDADKTRSSAVIDGSPVLRGGRVWLRTGSEPGNAVVAVRSASGEILWSWHVWIPQDAPQDESGNGYAWMDRNLGALNNAPGDISNRGMFYQWGRKDPMLPSSVKYEDATGTYSAHNTQTGGGSGEWDYEGTESRRTTVPPGNIGWSVRVPMTFIRQYGGTMSSYADWYLTLTEGGALDSYLWGSPDDAVPKTVFDPCPPGYRVPPVEAFTGDGPDDESPGWTGADYGKVWSGAGGSYFPCSGLMVLSTGLISYTGSLGVYWSRTPGSGTASAERLYLSTAGDRAPVGGAGRSYGHLVRCVRE